MSQSNIERDVELALLVGYAAGKNNLSGEETVSLLLEPSTLSMFNASNASTSIQQMIDILRMKLQGHPVSESSIENIIDANEASIPENERRLQKAEVKGMRSNMAMEDFLEKNFKSVNNIIKAAKVIKAKKGGKRRRTQHKQQRRRKSRKNAYSF